MFELALRLRIGFAKPAEGLNYLGFGPGFWFAFDLGRLLDVDAAFFAEDFFDARLFRRGEDFLTEDFLTEDLRVILAMIRVY